MNRRRIVTVSFPTERAPVPLAGFGFGDIFDGVKDVFDGIKDIVGDIFETTIDKLGKALPYLAAAGGFIAGGPGGAVTGFRLGSQVHNAQEAKEAGKDAQKQYEKAAMLANHLASLGIDISGNDPRANVLIQKLSADGYDYGGDDAEDLIDEYLRTRDVQAAAAAATQSQLTWAGAGLAALALVLYLRN